MTLLDAIKSVKINFAQGVVSYDTGSTLNYDFDISPKDFLSFSKQDFKTNDKRGNINALTNAKRAIDCQTDKIFCSIGLNPNEIPPAIEQYVSTSRSYPAKKDLPFRLRFLQAIAFAPAQIVSNTRLLRNKLEHYYKEPSSDEVANAIELAELFILATDNKLRQLWDFSLTDEDKNSKSKGYLSDCVYITYAYKKHSFNVSAYTTKNKKTNLQFDNKSVEFYYLLKIATSIDYDQDVQDAVIDLLEYIDHPIPKQNINIIVD